MACLVAATLVLAAALAAAQEEVCNVQRGVDVCITMDASGSITDEGYEQEKAFTLQLMSRFDESTTRVSIFSFSTSAREVASLNESFAETRAAVNEFGQNSGGTYIVGALESCSADLENDRPGRQKLLVLMTDGEGFSAEGQIRAAEVVKNASITLATIGIELTTEDGFDEETLTEMASDKRVGSGKLFYSFTIDRLPDESVSRLIATEVCSVVGGTQGQTGGLSTGGKAAIGILVPAALIGAAALVWKFALGGAMPAALSPAGKPPPVPDMEAAFGSAPPPPPPPPPAPAPIGAGAAAAGVGAAAAGATVVIGTAVGGAATGGAAGGGAAGGGAATGGAVTGSVVKGGFVADVAVAGGAVAGGAVAGGAVAGGAVAGGAVAGGAVAGGAVAGGAVAGGAVAGGAVAGGAVAGGAVAGGAGAAGAGGTAAAEQVRNVAMAKYPPAPPGGMPPSGVPPTIPGDPGTAATTGMGQAGAMMGGAGVETIGGAGTQLAPGGAPGGAPATAPGAIPGAAPGAPGALAPPGMAPKFRPPFPHQPGQPGPVVEGPGNQPGPRPGGPAKNPSAPNGPVKTMVDVLRKIPAIVICELPPGGPAAGPSTPGAEGGLEELGVPGTDGYPIHLSIALDTSSAGCYDEPGTGYRVRNTYAEAIGKLLMTLAVPAKGSVEISFVSVSGDNAVIPVFERKSRILSSLDDAKRVIKHVEPPHGANLSRATASGLIRATDLCSQLLDETDKGKRIIKRTLIVSPGGCPDEEMTSARRSFGPREAPGNEAGDLALWKTSPGVVLCTLGNVVDRGAAVQLGHVAVLCRDIEHFSADDVLKLIGGLVQAQDSRQRARL